MLHIIEGARPGENELLDAAFRLRKQVFIDEFKWPDLSSFDGKEIDRFDSVHAVYLVATNHLSEVVGNLRLLPTSKPHLLSTVHKHLWPRPYPLGLHCWEWTRYSISRNYRGGKAFSDVASELTLGAVEWGLSNGVRDVVVEYDAYLISRFAELGFDVTPLGLPQEMEGRQIVAVHMTYGEHSLATLRAIRGIDAEVARAQYVGAEQIKLPGRRREG